MTWQGALLWALLTVEVCTGRMPRGEGKRLGLEGILQRGPPQPPARPAAAAAVEMKPAEEVERPDTRGGTLLRRSSDAKASLVPSSLREELGITFHDEIPYASIRKLAKLKESKMAVVSRSPRPFALDRDSYLVSCLYLKLEFPDGSSNTYSNDVIPDPTNFAKASRLVLFYVRLLNAKADGKANKETNKLDGIRLRSTTLERDPETGSFGLSIKAGGLHSIADLIQSVSRQESAATTVWKEEYAQLQCFTDKGHFFRPQQGDRFFTMPTLTLSRFVAVSIQGSSTFQLCAYASGSAAATDAHAQRDAELASSRAASSARGATELASKFVSHV